MSETVDNPPSSDFLISILLFNRGFDTFYGYYTGSEHYFNHTRWQYHLDRVQKVGWGYGSLIHSRDAKSEQHEQRAAAIFPPAVLIFRLPTQKIC